MSALEQFLDTYGPQPKKRRPLTLVGLAELAAMLEVTKQGAAWRAEQEGFPEPIARLRATPVWDRRHVEDWLDARNTV